jgi:hypothetical protein
VNASEMQAAGRPVLTRAAAPPNTPAMPREDAMTEPSEPYPYPGPATTWPRPSADGAVPPMPSEVTNARGQQHSGGLLRKMMRRITRRP